MDITINLTTRNRYYSTLPICLTSIINQSLLPKEIILVDDNEKKDFHNIDIYKIFLSLCKYKNVKFSYYHGESKGQTYASQIAFEHTITPFIFKMDDDNILEYDVLELLSNTMNDNVGAVSGLILSKKDFLREIEYDDELYNRIEDIYSYFNIQMCGIQDNKIKRVEHIYSNYLFRKDIVDGYPIEFAPAGHREDTVFTYQIYKKGYDLLINPNCIIYHLNELGGGNRLYNYSMNTKNEILFIEKLKQWNIVPDKLILEENSTGMYAMKNNRAYVVYQK